MKKLALLPLLLLSACATQHQAASQNYRPTGQASAVQITGELFKDYGLIDVKHSAVIRFNGSDQIKVKLDRQFFGDGVGSAFNGQPTSANCSGRPVNRYTTEVRCMVFVGNEKTVTLTF